MNFWKIILGRNLKTNISYLILNLTYDHLEQNCNYVSCKFLEYRKHLELITGETLVGDTPHVQIAKVGSLTAGGWEHLFVLEKSLNHKIYGNHIFEKNVYFL